MFPDRGRPGRGTRPVHVHRGDELGTTHYLTSEYLRTLRTGDSDFGRTGGLLAERSGTDDEIVFHALFGNARLVDREVLELLDSAQRTPMSLDALRERMESDVLRDLFATQFLVPEGHDEQSDIDDLLRTRAELLPKGNLLSVLQLVLTNACNFTCDGCFAYNFDGAQRERVEQGESVKAGPVLLQIRKRQDSAFGAGDWNRGTSPGRNPSMHMSPSVAEHTVRQAVRTRAESGQNELSIAFFGGEPTLNRKTILHVLDTFGSECDGVRLSYRMTTNGSRMDDELIAALARHQVGVSVSVDYLDPETGEYRGGQQQKTPWPVVRSAIESLRAAGIPLKVASVLSSSTWRHWGHHLIDELARIGVDELDVTVAFQARQFFAEHQPSEVAQRLLAAYDYGQSVGVQLTGYWYHTYLMIVDEAKWAAQADYKTCPAIGRKLSIEPNGSVFACKATNRSLGTVDDWSGVFTSSAYRDYGMRAYRNGPACSGCELQGTCSGGSTGALEEENGSIHEMSPGYCAYIRQVVHGLLLRHRNLALAG